MASIVAEKTKISAKDAVVVANSFPYLRRQAFAFNNTDTCSAVAVCLALNYLTWQHQKAIVLPSEEAELLGAKIPHSPAENQQYYPKSYELYRFLIERCGMGKASFASGITRPFRRYITLKERENCALSMRWTIGAREKSIIENISADRPILITTTLAPQLNWHTVLVYGYRYINNKMQMLIHNGWYGRKHNDYFIANDEKYYYQKECWLDKKYASFSYYFSFAD